MSVAKILNNIEGDGGMRLLTNEMLLILSKRHNAKKNNKISLLVMEINDSNWVKIKELSRKRDKSSPEIMRIRIIRIIQKTAHKFSGVPKIRISAEPGHPVNLMITNIIYTSGLLR